MSMTAALASAGPTSPLISSRDRRDGIEIGADEVAPLLGIEPRGDAGRIPDRTTHIATDLENDKVRAKSLFATLNLPQDPDGLRVSDQGGNEVFFSDSDDR